jgi:hypothetical protein
VRHHDSAVLTANINHQQKTGAMRRSRHIAKTCDFATHREGLLYGLDQVK